MQANNEYYLVNSVFTFLKTFFFQEKKTRTVSTFEINASLIYSFYNKKIPIPCLDLILKHETKNVREIERFCECAALYCAF